MSKCSFDLIWRDQEAKTHILAEDAICCDASTWLTVLKKKKLQTSKKLQLQILEFNSVLFVWPKFITTGVSMGFVEPNIIDSFDAGTRPHTSDVSWSESWFLRWCWFRSEQASIRRFGSSWCCWASSWRGWFHSVSLFGTPALHLGLIF